MGKVQEGILVWYRREGRDLPWRKTTDPYTILISEIMLQQTQVDRVMPKFEAWLQAFPDWSSLAAAPRQEVLKLWSGLGYNNRAVRLHTLAKFVVEQLKGKLPMREEELMRLPGIGPYTAGAVRVFAHNKPGGCVDVNIERIIKRIFYGREEQPSPKEIKAMFMKSFPEEARDWGNGLMDFGSLICTAKGPKCDVCPVQKSCLSKGERPEEHAIRKKKRQTTFLHSNRWWRGQIIKRVATAPYKKEELLEEIKKTPTAEEKESYEKALEDLHKEKILEIKEEITIRNA